MKWITRRTLVALSLMALALASTPLHAAPAQQQPEALPLSGDVSPVHDPAIIREGDTTIVFASNRFREGMVPMFHSKDLRRWSYAGSVFEGVPEWAKKEVPGARGIWAPDISYVRGEYCLYYSVSTFGSNRSVIGLATNKTLDPARPDYRWIDKGKVVESRREDNWNAIDPNLTVDAKGNHWLVWGSYWGGIKMRRIDPATGMPSDKDTTLYSLASRPDPPRAIEAPFLVRKGRYYYLFVSFDACCRGAESTYKVMVGRSAKITGPYTDKAGKPMTEGGGTLVLEGNAAWRGPGHPAVLRDGKSDLLAFHAYHGKTGAPFLHLSTLVWEDGWPRAALSTTNGERISMSEPNGGNESPASPAPPYPFENEIREFERRDRENPPAPGAVLFIGSSSIGMWHSLKEDFPGVPVLNRGFGGSQVEHSTHFADRIVFPYRPSRIVFYAGDNDLGGGKSAEQVFEDYKAFVRKVRERLPEVPIGFIAIKPSPSRWNLVDKVKAANAMIREYTRKEKGLTYLDVFTPMLTSDGQLRPELYLEDRLHMNAKGYAIWREVVAPYLK